MTKPLDSAPHRGPLRVLPVLLLAMVTSSASAHVSLLSPNGGEVLPTGALVEIRWHVDIGHPTVGWDLYYSTQGPSGPWMPIALGLPPGNIATGAVHSRLWVVPDLAGSALHFRVVQDNTGMDWDDVSDGAVMVASSLVASPTTVSAAAGGTTTFAVDAGAATANRPYVVLGSVSSGPGIPLPPFLVPLHQDPWFAFTLENPNVPPLVDTLGVLDGSGHGTAALLVPAGLPPSVVGAVLRHAVLVPDGQGGWSLVSPAATVTLVP